MTATHQLPDGKLSEQANYWLVLSQSPFFDAEQQLAFQNWLAISQENQQAWQKAQVFWQQTGNLSHEQIALVEQRLCSYEPVQAIRSPRRVFPVYLATAACLIMAVSLSITEWPGLFADYRTAKGQQQLVALSDGSTILLNTDSALSVDFSQYARHLTLHGGEAYFTVTPDAQRPFTVQTEQGEVRALGTAFDVKQLDDAMAVTVYQHAVRVAFNQGATIERLSEGDRVEYSEGQSQPVESVNLNQAKAWREHRLVFKNQTLQEVTQELERYRSGKILILNQDLAQHRVTGIFDPRDTEAALTVIENTLAIKEYRLTDQLVLLIPLE